MHKDWTKSKLSKVKRFYGRSAKQDLSLLSVKALLGQYKVYCLL